MYLHLLNVTAFDLSCVPIWKLFVMCMLNLHKPHLLSLDLRAKRNKKKSTLENMSHECFLFRTEHQHNEQNTDKTENVTCN